MNQEELIQTGQDLATQLEQAAGRFYVRSDEHETLLWESSIVQARVKHITGGDEPTHFLADSRLNASNSHMLSPTLYQSTREFHQAYEQWRT